MSLPRINVLAIPHKEQRYPTVGDWWYDEEGVLQIRVSKLSSWRLEALIVVHELVEVLLCKHDRVSTESVDKFDMAYEKARKRGDESEPGDSPKAPYRRQHCVATGVERILAALLGVCWSDYERELNELP
jgi:hypothetical protein